MKLSKKIQLFFKTPPPRLEVIVILILLLIFSLFVGSATTSQIQNIKTIAQNGGPNSDESNPDSVIPTYACLSGQPCTSPQLPTPTVDCSKINGPLCRPYPTIDGSTPTPTVDCSLVQGGPCRIIGVSQNPVTSVTPTPACTPGPACLDANPACQLNEPAGGWCPNPATSVTPTPACTPRPACLDANPACQPEPATSWCPKTSVTDVAVTPGNQCTPRPACLDANPACQLNEPAGG